MQKIVPTQPERPQRFAGRGFQQQKPSTCHGWRRLGVMATSILPALLQVGFPLPLLAQPATLAACQLDQAAIAQRETLRRRAATGDGQAKQQYQQLVQHHTQQLSQCRTDKWPANLAIWLRLYPCDAAPGVLDRVLDQIVSRGYNQIYVEVFYSGQVLLPLSDNPTPWPSVVQGPGNEQVDLLAQVIEKGRARGLKVYAWVFTMNFGYTYAQYSDRQSVLARNGSNQTSLSVPNDTDDPAGSGTQVYIDPYHPQARQDFRQLIQTIAKRKPDGILFDYVRYPKGQGTASVVSRVQDLWIYGEASQQAFYQRALNSKALELMQQFLRRGYVTNADIQAADKRYPQEKSPMWQGYEAMPKPIPANQRQSLAQQQLWLLSVAHAFQGVLEFVTAATETARARGVPSGVVFFPEGNQVLGQGYDSRLQLWENFPRSLEWHPMAYAICGDGQCVAAQVQRVLNQAPPGTQIKPALAGVWGRTFANHPPLEVQMQALKRSVPQLQTVSHFAYSWQEPEGDRQRKFCKL